MNQNLKSVLYATGTAIVLFLVINLLHFGIEVYRNGLGDNWSIQVDKGTFYVDGQAIGNEIPSKGASRVFIIGFVISLYQSYKKGELSFKKK